MVEAAESNCRREDTAFFSARKWNERGAHFFCPIYYYRKIGEARMGIGIIFQITAKLLQPIFYFLPHK
jgi:hypothetical protein